MVLMLFIQQFRSRLSGGTVAGLTIVILLLIVRFFGMRSQDVKFVFSCPAWCLVRLDTPSDIRLNARELTPKIIIVLSNCIQFFGADLRVGIILLLEVFVFLCESADLLKGTREDNLISMVE